MATSIFGNFCDYDNYEKDWQNYVVHLELFLQQTRSTMCKKRELFFDVIWDRNKPII